MPANTAIFLFLNLFNLLSYINLYEIGISLRVSNNIKYNLNMYHFKK